MAGVFAGSSTLLRSSVGGATPESDLTPSEDPGAILRFEPSPPTQPIAGRSVAVLDTAWTAPTDAGDQPVGLRDIAERVLASRDLNAETADLLDAWAAASGVVDTMAIEGASFWYQSRVGHGMWLREQILWLGILDELVATLRPRGIECAAGSDEAVVQVAQLVAARDGLAFLAESRPIAGPSAGRSAEATPRPSLLHRLGRRIRSRLRPDERTRRGRLVIERVDRLARAQRRPLLAVHAHAVQRVDGPDGPRFIDAYLDPIEARLRGSRLDPVTIEMTASIDNDQTWQRLVEAGSERVLPADVIRLIGTPEDLDRIRAQAEQAADRIGRLAVPVIVSGVDLGPALAARVDSQARRLLASRAISIWRIRRLIRRLRPAGLLLADEYHRQDWLAAAHAEGVATVAVQHGLIYRWHNGYIHRARPAALRLPDRTYVFGRWERRLLTSASVYREDEVLVGGSPRLDLVAPEPVDRETVRAELGVASGDRLVVISGTWGTTDRRFRYPITLARLIDRPLPRIHLVIKLHPREPDDGPYREVIEGVAAARGFQAPPITVVRTIDLYRLLGAADAHLGIHSTVLTEAVAAGTPNLLADTLAGADLLGYVSAGVALPIRNGADLLAALDAAAAGAIDAAARRAFLDDHFEPGDASGRIASELLEWLP
jgi:hypothetical protein